MASRRKLEDGLRDAAEALRAVEETICDDEDRDNRRPSRDLDADRRGCFGSSRELQRLCKALLEAVEVVREATAACCRDPICDDSPACDAPCETSPLPPMPPYPPYPPYAPHAPFPPYPPYPPVVVIGGGSCGCSCQQAPPVVPPPAVLQAPSPTPLPQAPTAAPTAPPITVRSAVTSASPVGFPDTADLHNVEAILDMGESAAALVQRTLANPSAGAGP